MPAKLRKTAELQAGVVSRKQAVADGASPGEIDAKLRFKRWQQVHRGVYATFTGALSRRARLWAAVLYAGQGAMLSHDSAGELQGLADKPADAIHVTVPASRRVAPVPGVVIHRSDLPERREECSPGEIPVTRVADTLIDLAEACASVDDVYGWVTRAFGRHEVPVTMIDLLVAVRLRKKLRWRAEITEAIVAADGGAHSALELLWEKNVEEPHGLPAARKQVPFKKENGKVGYRDREYVPWGVIIELDGKKSHPAEQRGQDNARDRQASVRRKETMHYGWREAKYAACESATEVIWVLWRRGWRGRPKPCSAGCPVASLLGKLDTWLAADPERRRKWLERQAVQEAARLAQARRQADSWQAVRQAADEVARARTEMRALVRR
jgi:hypothetical protein